MKGSRFCTRDAEYEIIDEDSALLVKIKEHDKFIVPASVASPAGKKYLITGIFGKKDYSFDDIYNIQVHEYNQIDEVSFEQTSEIDNVEIYFIHCCNKSFFLPPKVKRIINKDQGYICPKIYLDKSINFVSVISNRSILNNFPLKIVHYKRACSRYVIRETVRTIGFSAFDMAFIKSVTIPASVEMIGDFAFILCFNLKSAIFKRRSNVKSIGCHAFSPALDKFHFPASVEVIKDRAFHVSTGITSITFECNSRLKSIGDYAFYVVMIKKICFPASLELIGKKAFSNCTRLASISFPEDSNMKKIKFCAFSFTGIETVAFPSKIEKIGKHAFIRCQRLSSFTFLSDPKQVKLGENVFYGCPCETEYNILYLTK